MAPDASAIVPAEFGFVRPLSIDAGLRAVARPGATILCGGTDLYPAHVGRPFPENVVDVSAIRQLRGVTREDQGWRIGGATTWSEISEASLPPPFRALRQAARQVGAIQVQNRGTIAGNLCNASPAADGVPPLLILDADVELASLDETRRMPLGEFLLGNRKTARRSDEILTAILVDDAPGAASAFVKLGARKYLVISIVMAAALLRRDETGAIAEARVSVGAASATARRLAALERELLGLTSDRAPSSRLRAEHVAALAPIDDSRATAAYRIDASLALIGEALDDAWREAQP